MPFKYLEVLTVSPGDFTIVIEDPTISVKLSTKESNTESPPNAEFPSAILTDTIRELLIAMKDTEREAIRDVVLERLAASLEEVVDYAYKGIHDGSLL